MSETLPLIYVVRHGETAWNFTGQHMGRIDMPLSEQGERNARLLGERLRGLTFAKIFTSPLQRASQTCELAGFKAAAEVDPDLTEWDYGSYEGKTTEEILKERPGWQMFRDGFPGGESVEQVCARVDRVVSRVLAVEGNVLLFSHGHFLRMLAARWLGLEPGAGRLFFLSPASLSVLGYEDDRSRPVIRLWDDTCHLGTRVSSRLTHIERK
jgi:probable phosphoglycerate mutase